MDHLSLPAPQPPSLQHGLDAALTPALRAAIQAGLRHRFGEAGLPLLAEIVQLEDLATLAAIHATLFTATSPAELRRLYA